MSTPYTSLLAELKTTVQRARVHAIQQVNRSLILLLGKGFGMEVRLFYLEISAQHGWTRAVLSHQISVKLYERTNVRRRINR